MLNDVMTLEEAAELWNKSTDSLRQACISPVSYTHLTLPTKA